MPQPTRRPSPAASLALVLAAAAFGSALGRGAEPAPLSFASADPGADETPAPGWTLTFDSPEESARSWPSSALALPEGTGLHPHLDRAQLAATLSIGEPGRYRFGVDADGGFSAELVVSGTADGELIARATRRDPQLTGADRSASPRPQWSEWTELEPGPVTLRATLERSHAAAGRAAWVWERAFDDDRGFRPEPIPIDRLAAWKPEASVAAEKLLAPADRARVAALGCHNCHATDPQLAALYERRGPSLEGLSERVHPAWLARWIADPQAVKPGCGMPSVFAPEGEATAVEALVHYLLDPSGEASAMETLPSAPTVQPPAIAPEALAAGRRLYHTVGCVACHGALVSPAEAFDNELLSDALPAVDVPAPFAGPLAQKWKRAGLAAYLADPVRIWPHGGMPALGLSAEEAELVANYLLGANAGGTGAAAPAETWRPSTPWSADLAERGRLEFDARGCAACHLPPGEDRVPYAAPTATPWAALALENGGCVTRAASEHPELSGPDGHKGGDAPLPRYELEPEALAAIARGLAADWAIAAPGGADGPIAVGETAWAALACGACHERHGAGGVPEPLRPYFANLDERSELGDEGRIPPALDGVGRKLTTPWLQAVLFEGARARPYMATRMPQFGRTLAEPFVHGLAWADGAYPTDVPDAHERRTPEVTDELVLGGNRLMGLRGLACISCHVVGDRPPAGTAGPDMTRFAERLRYGWFADYMHAPARYKPGTRMPQFTTEGRSAIVDLWDGDAERQIDAMWAYFTLAEFAPVPEGVPAPPGSGALQLVPGERPLVFRTFLESVGSRAICVGFPAGLHFAFDADKVRLAEVWQGDFVDASASWTARGGSEATGRGPVVWRAPDAPGLAVVPAGMPVDDALDIASPARFLGYVLSPEGHPTFRYELRDARGTGAVEVEETWTAYPRPGALFRRRFAVRGLDAATLWLSSGERGEFVALENAALAEGGALPARYQTGFAVVQRDPRIPDVAFAVEVAR